MSNVKTGRKGQASKTLAWKQFVKRRSYFNFMQRNKQEQVFDKSKVVYRDGDNT